MTEPTRAAEVHPPADPAPAPPGMDEALRALVKPARGSWVAALVLGLVAFVFLRQSDAPLRQALVLAGVVLFHELGHVVAMRLLGYRDVRVFFIPFFGALTTASSAPPARWKQAVVSLAGPIPGLVVALAVFVSPLRAHPLAWETALTAVFLNGFNLLPLGFLDGGRVLDRLVFQRHRVLEAAFAGLSALAFAGLALALRDWVLGVIGFFSLVAIPHAYRLARSAGALAGRLSPGDVERLPRAELELLYSAALALVAEGKARTRADVMRDLHSRATTPPASWRATAALTLVWLGAILGSVVILVVGMRPDVARMPVVTSTGEPLTPAFAWTPGQRARVKVVRRVGGPREGAPGGRALTWKTAYTVEAVEDGRLSVVADAAAPEDAGAALAAHEVEGAERELWQTTVGVVPRRPLVPGEELVLPSSATNSATGEPVRASITYRLEGRVACELPDADDACALLTYRVSHEAAEGAPERESHGFVVFEAATLFPRLGYRARTQRWGGPSPGETSDEVRIELEPER